MPKNLYKLNSSFWQTKLKQINITLKYEIWLQITCSYIESVLTHLSNQINLTIVKVSALNNSKKKKIKPLVTRLRLLVQFKFIYFVVRDEIDKLKS